MSKHTLNIKMSIDDKYEYDILRNIEILKKNERLSEFCSQAIKDALNDPEKVKAINQKIDMNDNGITMDRQTFYDLVLTKLNNLEKVIETIRFDLHTVTTLAEQEANTELSTKTLAMLDSLYEELNSLVREQMSDYFTFMKWTKKESELLQKFKDTFAEIKEQVQKPTELNNSSELLMQLLQEVTTVKEKLANGVAITTTTPVEQPVVVEEVSSSPVITDNNVQYEEATDVFEGDLDAMAGFFGL